MTASSYKPGGPLASLSLANGLTETRAFDNRYRPDRIQAGSLLDWDYTEDAVGNPTQITGTIVGQPYSATFTYQDPQYFLTQGNGPWGPRFWTYDRIGNRLTNQESGEPAQTYTYAGTGHNPKLMQIAPAPGLGAGTLQFGYDAAGNQTSKQQTDGEGDSETQFLDASQENKLSALRAGAGPGRSDMLYDGRGYLRQAHLTFSGSPEFVKVSPTYSSEGLLMARAEDRAWTGSTPGPDGEDSGWLALNSEATRLFYFAGRPVAQLTDGPELLYLTTDHLGTPVLATSPGGVAVWAGGLEPFGRVWTAGGNPDPEPLAARGKLGVKALGRLSAESVFLRYPGQWASDAFRLGGVEGDLYYNLHRWYPPGTGRYLSPDPVGLRAGPHPYIYARSNSLLFVDRFGLQSTAPPPTSRDPFVAPFDTRFPSGPWGKRPDSKCCDQKEIRDAVDNTDYQARGLAEGRLPSGTIGASITRGHACFESGWCQPMAPSRSEPFNPYISPRIKDPCVRFCVRVHEWYHYTDARWWYLYWDDITNNRHMEAPAYGLERACLLNFLQ